MCFFAPSQAAAAAAVFEKDRQRVAALLWHLFCRVKQIGKVYEVAGGGSGAKICMHFVRNKIMKIVIEKGRKDTTATEKQKEHWQLVRVTD